MQKSQKQSKAQIKPTSNNGQFRSLWEMDENEKLLQEQHQQQLKQKYRDRAKERRQGVSDLKHDGLIGGSSDSESNDEDKYVKIQGLDYEKLEQVRKEIADTEEQKQKNKQAVENIRKQLLEDRQKKNKEPGPLAKKILQYLKEQSSQSNKVVFPQPFQYYKYELKNQFASNIPVTVIKQRHQDQVPSAITNISDNCFQKIKKIMKILKTGGKQQLKVERERQKIEEEKNKQLEEQKLKEELRKQRQDKNDDIFDDLSGYEDENQYDNELKQEPVKKIKLLKDDEEDDIFGLKQEENKKNEEKEGQQKKEKEKTKSTKDLLSKLIKDDGYSECFQQTSMSMAQLKQMKQESQQLDTKKKNKKENFDNQLNKIEKIWEKKNK